MSEGLDQWSFVIAAYSVGVTGTVLLVGWAWRAMVRAEARRDRARER
jgi:hypothetical protein